MDDILICPITVEQARPLRSAVLRPGLPFERTFFDCDARPETFHAGAFRNSELVGIATVSVEPFPLGALPGDWRLRGMAVHPDLHGQSIGGAVLQHCLDHIRQQGGRRCWCNARTVALGFYRRLGFESFGDEFDIPVSGPHFCMARRII